MENQGRFVLDSKLITECANCCKHIGAIIVSSDKDPLVFCSESCLIEYKLFDGEYDEYLLDKHISGE